MKQKRNFTAIAFATQMLLAGGAHFTDQVKKVIKI